jgi:DNA-binding Xre family transcriptional regulator
MEAYKDMTVRWRLKEVMARYDIRNIDLQQAMQLNKNAISNLKNAKSMPRIDGKRLDQLCKVLSELSHERITPETLIEYTPD